jgi:GIY-YIG catalytic domain
MKRRRLVTKLEVTSALRALEFNPHRVRANAWPATFRDLDSPGLYSWWVDTTGAQDLTIGLGHLVPPERIYAGQTGATRWPSGTTPETTLRRRIGGNHLRGRIRSSTFRLTLAAALHDALHLRPTNSTSLDASWEAALSDWIRAHLEIAVHPFEERDALAHLEHRVLRKLDPPLNLDGMRVNPLRAALTMARSALGNQSPTVALNRSAGGVAAVPRRPIRAKPTPTGLNLLIQGELRRRGLSEVSAVDAAGWLDTAAVLPDSERRPGLPLRRLLREGSIEGAEQRPPAPNGRWFIVRFGE